MTPSAWPLPLGPDEVHVWRFELDRLPTELTALAELLADDERRRAERFAFPRLRERYIAGRGLLRTILGRYLDEPPEALAFGYHGQGKPYLARPGMRIEFNLAHSDGLALLAISRERQLGIDVERIRPDRDCDRLAERYFAPAEVMALRALPEDQRQAAFFTCWARKEAYVKATGVGIAAALDRFTVLPLHGGLPRLEVADDADESGRWAVRDLAAGEGFGAALMAEGQDWSYRLENWDGVLPWRG